MKIYRSLSSFPENEKISLVIGNFDGVHLGHCEIIRECRKNGGICAVLTFDIHPREFLFPDFPPGRLTLKHEKYTFLERLGVDVIFELPFAQFHSIEPIAFLDLLNNSLDIGSITVGFNFFFGRNQTGSADLLYWWGRSSGVKITVVPPFVKNGMRVSSTAIREFILEGELIKSQSFLLFPYVISGEVMKGDQIGRQLNFPTLNQSVPNKMVPPDGVYLTQTVFDGNQKRSITNIGHRPTIDSEFCERRIETWIVDEKIGEMYGRNISVYFLKKIRNEIKFSSKEKLTERILDDRMRFVEFWKDSEINELPEIKYSFDA